MLTKHLNYVTLKMQSVKLMTAGILTSAALALVPMTAQASPGLDNIVQTKHSVKLSSAMFASEEGVQQVYNTLQKRAQKACKVGKTIGQDGEIISKSECIADLVGQFVENADVKTLTAYHTAQQKMGG